jgi:hypothetical protein
MNVTNDRQYHRDIRGFLRIRQPTFGPLGPKTPRAARCKGRKHDQNLCEVIKQIIGESKKYQKLDKGTPFHKFACFDQK